MSNRCGDCKYKGGRITVYVTSQLKKKQTAYYMCKAIGEIDECEFIEPGLGAVVGGDKFYSPLCVEDSFGCNKWESKS